jgi:hypothetical protein
MAGGGVSMGKTLTMTFDERLTERLTFAAKGLKLETVEELVVGFLRDVVDHDDLRFENGVPLLPSLGRVLTVEEVDRLYHGYHGE